jgi:enterobacterial common antigen flippase
VYFTHLAENTLHPKLKGRFVGTFTFTTVRPQGRHAVNRDGSLGVIRNSPVDLGLVAIATSIPGRLGFADNRPMSKNIQVIEPPANGSGTYGQILKSSALIGGSSVLNIAIGIVRTKAMALLLGPAAYGLFGLYGSIANLAQSIAGMGVSSSGVRQIATAVGSGDTERIALTTIVLRRTSIALGLLGAVLLLVFAPQVSAITFGTNQHASEVRLLSIAVLFQLISWGQDALIQGMRRIADLAKMQVLGALFGTILSIPLVYFLRERGVVPSLVSVAVMYFAVSWWYSRKVRIQTPEVTVSEVTREAAALLKLGLMFTTTIFMTMGIAYGVRIMVLREVGFAATGYYQSAWTLGGLYVGIILQAMGADFYPRLTAVADDNIACNRLVNEQVQVGLLLGGPGVLTTLTFAPTVIAVFYSTKFGAAVEVLRWICLGAILQVVTWPMVYITIAKGRQLIYFSTQLAWTVVSLSLAYFCVRFYGLNGAGIAFFCSYIFFGFMEYTVVHRLSDFSWSSANKETGLVFLFLITVVFCSFYLLPFLWAACFGVTVALLSGIYSIRVLSRLITWEQIPSPVRRLLVPFLLVYRRAAGNS